ncbi:hypothetical protein D3C80_1092030 [compost metagenome]
MQDVLVLAVQCRALIVNLSVGIQHLLGQLRANGIFSQRGSQSEVTAGTAT